MGGGLFSHTREVQAGHRGYGAEINSRVIPYEKLGATKLKGDDTAMTISDTLHD
jgi:hypothetical protein